MMVQQINNDFGAVSQISYTKAPDTPLDVSSVVPKPVPGFSWRWDSLGTGIEYYNVNDLGATIVPVATDAEITNGIETQTRLVSPFQTKLAVTTHETPPIMDIYNVQWVEVLAALPGTPDPNTLYLIKQ